MSNIRINTAGYNPYSHPRFLNSGFLDSWLLDAEPKTVFNKVAEMNLAIERGNSVRGRQRYRFELRDQALSSRIDGVVRVRSSGLWRCWQVSLGLFQTYSLFFNGGMQRKPYYGWQNMPWTLSSLPRRAYMQQSIKASFDCIPSSRLALALQFLSLCRASNTEQEQQRFLLRNPWVWEWKEVCDVSHLSPIRRATLTCSCW